jgi:outer membrane beta-barrel protein
MKKQIIPYVLVFLACLGARNGFCRDEEKTEEVSAVQERIFFKYHEIDLGIGYIGDDDFYNVFPIGMRYIFNFNDHIAWNVADAQLMINHEKDLKKDLEKDFGAAPSQFSELKFAIHSNFIIKPLYGKDVFGSHRVINHETYLFLGGGVTSYERKYSNGNTDSEVAPSLSFGIGKKIFIGEKLCVFAELKDWVNFREKDLENNFWFSLSLGFRFNLSPRKTNDDATVEKLDKYLK